MTSLRFGAVREPRRVAEVDEILARQQLRPAPCSTVRPPMPESKTPIGRARLSAARAAARARSTPRARFARAVLCWRRARFHRRARQRARRASPRLRRRGAKTRSMDTRPVPCTGTREFRRRACEALGKRAIELSRSGVKVRKRPSGASTSSPQQHRIVGKRRRAAARSAGVIRRPPMLINAICAGGIVSNRSSISSR